MRYAGKEGVERGQDHRVGKRVADEDAAGKELGVELDHVCSGQVVERISISFWQAEADEQQEPSPEIPAKPSAPLHSTVSVRTPPSACARPRTTAIAMVFNAMT